MKWLLLLLLMVRPLAAQDRDSAVVVFKRAAQRCTDSTAILLREVLAKRDSTKPTVWGQVRTWAPLALTAILVIYGTRTKVVYVDRLVPVEKPHDDDDEHGHH